MSTDYKIQTMKAQTDEVIDIMRNNIDKTLQRSERIEDLEERSTQLEHDSKIFQHSTRRLKYQMWCQDKKMCLIITTIIAVIIMIIILVATQ